MKARTLPGLIVGAMIGAASLSCSPHDDRDLGLQEDPAMAELILVQDADAAQALELAWKRGDRRFIGVGGLALSAPGTETETGAFDDLVHNKYGIRQIEGTGDTAPEKYQALRAGAIRYAEQYNRLLLKKLGYNPPPPKQIRGSE